MGASALHGFEHAVCSAVPLASVTSFHIGGPAEYFVEPESFDELVRVVDRCIENGLLMLQTGRGTLKIAPPLSIPQDALRKGIAVIAEAIEAELG